MIIPEKKRTWSEQKNMLKLKLAFFTENDPMLDEEKKTEMFAKLQIKFGKSKEELLRIISGT